MVSVKIKNVPGALHPGSLIGEKCTFFQHFTDAGNRTILKKLSKQEKAALSKNGKQFSLIWHSCLSQQLATDLGYGSGYMIVSKISLQGGS